MRWGAAPPRPIFLAGFRPRSRNDDRKLLFTGVRGPAEPGELRAPPARRSSYSQGRPPISEAAASAANRTSSNRTGAEKAHFGIRFTSSQTGAPAAMATAPTWPPLDKRLAMAVVNR